MPIFVVKSGTSEHHTDVICPFRFILPLLSVIVPDVGSGGESNEPMKKRERVDDTKCTESLLRN